MHVCQQWGFVSRLQPSGVSRGPPPVARAWHGRLQFDCNDHSIRSKATPLKIGKLCVWERGGGDRELLS